MLREEIEATEGESANVERFLSIVERYTDIPKPSLCILHEFVEKIVVHVATDPHSKTKPRQEIDIYYKGIGVLEISKIMPRGKNKRNGIAVKLYRFSLVPRCFLIGS